MYFFDKGVTTMEDAGKYSSLSCNPRKTIYEIDEMSDL